MNNKWYNLFYVKEGRIFLILTGLSLIGSSILGFFIPVYIKSLADFYNTEFFLSKIYTLGIIFISIYLTKIVFGLSIMKYATLMMQSIRSKVYSKWLLFPDTIEEGKTKQRDYPQGEVMARIMSDSEAIRDLITSGTLNVLIELILVISCFISFMNINFKLGVLLAIVEIGVVIIFLTGSKKMRDSFLRVRQTRGKLSHIVANSVGGMKELYYNVHHLYIIKRCKFIFKKYLKDILNSILWDASYYSFSESIVPLFLVLIVYLIPYYHITEVALILTIVDLIQRSIRPLKSIASQIGNVQRAYGGIFRVNQFLTDLTIDKVKETTVNTVLKKVKKISFEIPSFEYPQKIVKTKETTTIAKTIVQNANLSEGEISHKNNFLLKNINVSFIEGKKYAFVGLSGCGKSTLLNIISGSIVPSHYSIKINEDIIDTKLSSSLIWYRKHVGLISQDSHVFSNSLSFNLSFSIEIDDGIVQFWKYIKNEIPYLKQWSISLDSLINVEKLSLGQKQLLAALRSLYLKKEIVLFDEISSSLDSNLESSLSKVISLISKNSITLFVAHRIETIMACDQIHIMQDGKIIDCGRHKELENRSQMYKNFLKELSDSKLQENK